MCLEGRDERGDLKRGRELRGNQGEEEKEGQMKNPGVWGDYVKCGEN